LRSWESSGQSGPEYARKHGLGKNILYAWRSKRNRANELASTRSEGLSMLPVSVVDTPEQKAVQVNRLSCLSMRCNGVEVYVSGPPIEELAVVAGQIHKEVFDV